MPITRRITLTEAWLSAANTTLEDGKAAIAAPSLLTAQVPEACPIL